MPPLIKDYLEFRKVDYLPAINPTNLKDCLRTFLSTDGLMELLSRILEAIFKRLNNQQTTAQEPTSILLTGGYGVGKSHLLSVIHALIIESDSLPSSLNDPRVQAYIEPLRGLAPLAVWIDISEQTNTPLPELVLREIHKEYEKRFHQQLLDPSSISGIGTIKAHELITFNIAPQQPLLLVIDGLSKRARERDVRQLNEDIEFLSFMAYSSKSTRLFLLVSAHEDFFSPKSPVGISSTLMAQTLENFKIEWIDRINLREIIYRNILRKNPRQQQDLRKLYSFIKAKIPNFQPTENEFFETYPFHPIIFDLCEKIKSKLAGFSLLDFVMTTYPKIATYRAISLVTLDNLFDRLEYEIKTTPSCHGLYSIYQNLASQAVSRLDDRWKLWGKMLLKATFIFTLADRAPSVRDLTDSLLLFEDSETGLSYNVVGMLLRQMEKAVEHGFTTTDDRLDRTYRLGMADLREEVNKYLANIAGQITDSDPRLAQILLDAATKHFPDWPMREDLLKNSPAEQNLLRVNWKGTERAGLFLYSHRLLGRKYPMQREPADDFSISQRLPSLPESFREGGNSETVSLAESLNSSDGSRQEIEWLLWLEPIGLTQEVENTIRPQRPTEINWLPSLPMPEEISQLKKALALHLTQESTSTDFVVSDLQSVRDELNLALGDLFRELYLTRGKIISNSQFQALNQRHLECQTFQSFLNYLFKPNLDQLYPLHPDFGGEQLSEKQVITISHKLLASQDPTDAEVQKLAAKFALPLGLVSRFDGLYELNFGITPPIFLNEILQYLEKLEAVERPIGCLFEKVRRPPFGLTQPSLHLILTALVADGQIELFNAETNTTINRENLFILENVQAFPTFKRISTCKEFPVEVLSQWCRLITGKQELPDISTSRGRNAAVNALSDWLRYWRELGVSKRLDSLPNQFLTTQMWRKLVWTRRRFEKVAEMIEMILQEQISLVQGMAKIIDRFGGNVSLLEKTSRNLVELSHFIRWFDNFLIARDYLLSSEKTGNPEIEKEREALLRSLEVPHELVANDRTNQFERLFASFKEHYIDYYARRHDQSVGPLGNFNLLDDLESSKDFRNLQLLASLPLGDSSYANYLEEWIIAFRDYRCSLPVRDLLQKESSCKCTFKLSRPLDIAQVVMDLQAFLELGLSHHKQVIHYYRHVIEPKLSDESGQVIKNGGMIHSLLGEGPLPELTQEFVDQLNSLINPYLLEEKLKSPLPIIAPTGRITKKQLETRMQKWLESLSDQEDLLFSLKDS